MQIHNYTIIRTQEDYFIKIYTSQFIVTFVCERELETEQNCNILTPTLKAVSVVSFSFSRAAQLEALNPTLQGDGFLYCILSATSLDPSSIGGPEPLWPGLAFPTTLVYNSLSNCLTFCLDRVI